MKKFITMIKLNCEGFIYGVKMGWKLSKEKPFMSREQFRVELLSKWLEYLIQTGRGHLVTEKGREFLRSYHGVLVQPRLTLHTNTLFNNPSVPKQSSTAIN